jgi:hypothetical protein
MIGVSVTFRYNEDFDRARVVSITENARGTFEGMPGLTKVFTVDDARQRAMKSTSGNRQTFPRASSQRSCE